MKKKMKNLFEDRLKDVQERTKVNTSYMGGSCLSLRAMEGHRVVVVEVYEAQNKSKVHASSKSGSCLILQDMEEHRGVVVNTNVEENRGKYEFVEYEVVEYKFVEYKFVEYEQRRGCQPTRHTTSWWCTVSRRSARLSRGPWW
jgi:hypothetical protein